MSEYGLPILHPPTDPVVGIDLGTTNSVVALAVESGELQVLGDALSRRVQPSVVAFHPSGSVLVGHKAKERRIIDARNTIYAAKRLIGQTLDAPGVASLIGRLPFAISEGINRAPIIRTRAGQFSPAEISAIILDHMRDIAERSLDTKVRRAVVTVPANFTDAQRVATENAGTMAGVEIARVINEPTAAALAYGHKRQLEELIAVYDFGGGTFDVSIVKLNQDVYEVLGTAGHAQLGGEDIDEVLAEVMVDAFLRQERVDLRENRGAMQRLRSVAEQIKIQLSQRSRAVVKIDEIAYGVNGRPLHLHFEMTRQQLEMYARDKVDQTFPVCQEAARMAGLSPTQVQEVVLVGGSTRMPYVRERVAQFFQKTPRSDVNPDEAVAIGAALQGMAMYRMLGAGATQTRRPVVERYTPGDDADGRPREARARMRAPTFDPKLQSGFDEPTVVPSGTPAVEAPEPVVQTLDIELPQAGGTSRLGAPITPIATPMATPMTLDIEGLTEPPSEDAGSATLDALFDDLPTSHLGPERGARSLDESFDIDAEVTSSTHTLDIGRQSVSGHIDLSGVESNAIELDLASLLEGDDDSSIAVSPATSAPLSAGDEMIDVDMELLAAWSSAGDEPTASVVLDNDPLADLPFPISDPGDEVTASVVLDRGRDDAPGVPLSMSDPFADDDEDSGESATVILDAASVAQKQARAAEDAHYRTTDVHESLSRANAADTDSASPESSLVRVSSDQRLRTTQVPVLAITQAHSERYHTPDIHTSATNDIRSSEKVVEQSPEPSLVPSIIDVTPRAIGIGTVSGYCEVLIPRNQRVPATVSRSFTTSKDGQEVVRILVCQGDSRRISENTVLGNLLLQGIAPRPRGESQIDVAFEVDASGILRVQARDSATGKQTQAQLDILGRTSDAQVQAAAQRLRQILR